jgi:hypothetical protein
VTTPDDHQPTRPAIARDLQERAESARTAWRTPAVQLSAMAPDELATLRAIDRDNTLALRRIVAQYNWPGRSLVGDEACQAALVIALHADHDPAFQTTLLWMLHGAVQRGEATPAQWAHLQDRCLVHASQQQLYGTQYWYRPDGRLEPHRIADPEDLGARRSRVGLPPFADQAERLRRHHTDASSLSTCVVVVPRPVVERPAA